jgi:hypothetical protein
MTLPRRFNAFQRRVAAKITNESRREGWTAVEEASNFSLPVEREEWPQGPLRFLFHLQREFDGRAHRPMLSLCLS